MVTLTIYTIITIASILPLAAQFRKGTKLPDITEQNRFYSREEIPMPKGKVLEVGSIALLPDKKIAIGTRRGEIWVVTGAYEKDLSKVSWKLIFSGAHEPLGMFEKKGWIHFMDRDAYARISDKDANGSYETYQVISNKWGMSGDYHEYNFGSTPDKDGNVYVVHCLTGSARARAEWRGWGQKISPDGTTTPFASGVRSPGGIGYNVEGDIFYTDNQGMWNGTSCLKHLKQGSFTGNPSGNIYYKNAPHMGPHPLAPRSGSRIVKEAKRIPQFVPPAVQIPHGKIGQSPTSIIADHTNGKFGPFQQQLLIGEQTHAQVQRIYLEKVNGVYQGAVWHFLGGFRSGIIASRLASDGTLFAGGNNRGWASAGDKPFTLERVRWKGTLPFEMLSVKALSDGFKISLTEPLPENVNLEIKNFKVRAWTYIYQKGYGSPEVDKVQPKITSVEMIGEKEIKLTLDSMIQGHVYHINVSSLKSNSGQDLWHNDVYYTLNQIPRRTR